MAEWPELDELKQVLDVTSEDWDGLEVSGSATTRLSRLLEAAIDYVKGRIGDWDDGTDLPTARQSQAALRMAELLALRADSTPDNIHDPTFDRLIAGSRRVFGIG